MATTTTRLLVVVENLDSMLESLEDKLEKDEKPCIQNEMETLRKTNMLDDMIETLEGRLNNDGVSTTYKGVCATCEDPIHGKVCNALGRAFHPEHFLCEICNVELYSVTFYERGGKAFCEKDYHAQYAPRCFACNEPVVGACVTMDDRTWHPDHFICDECKMPFDEFGFYEKDNKAYCINDYKRLFAPKCPGCDDYVLGVVVNKCWHKDCFNCTDCKDSLEGRNFYDYHGKPYCETHYRAKRKSICHACNKLILRQCMTAMGHKFHPEHFTCNYCNQELNQGTYKETNGKPYCKRCHLKAFGYY